VQGRTKKVRGVNNGFEDWKIELRFANDALAIKEIEIKIYTDK